MAYNVTLSNGSTIVTIPDGAVFNTYSVPLIGQNTSAYGDDVAAAFLRSVENFAFTQPPDINPNVPGSVLLTGQLWYDTSTSTLNVYDGATWEELLTPSSGLDSVAGDIIPALDSTYDLGAVGLRWQDVYADNITYGGTVTAEGSSNFNLSGTFTADGGSTVDLNGTVNIAGATMDGRLDLADPDVLNLASLRFPEASGAPASTATGDMWIENDGVHVIINGTERTLAETGPASGVTTFNGRSGAVVPLEADYSGFFAQKNAGTTTTVNATSTWTYNNVPTFANTTPFAVSNPTLITNLNAQLLNGQTSSFYAQDSQVVKITGTQAIDGDKTFTNKVRINSDDNQALRLIGSSTGNANQVYISFYESNDSTEILRIGDDTANGFNTFDAVSGQATYFRTAGDIRISMLDSLGQGIVGLHSMRQEELTVQDPTVNVQRTTGATVSDFAGSKYNVGYNQTPAITVSGSVTLSEIHIGKLLQRNSATNTTITLNPSTNIPIGGSALLHNDNATGTYTIGQGVGATIEWIDGTGSAPPTGNRTLAYNSIATIRRKNTAGWQIWGNGIS